MQTKTAFISFCNRKTCFIGLTQSLAVSMPREGISVFEVEWGGGSLYTSWQGDLSTHTPGGTANTVDINGLYGSKLGLKDGEQVVIKSVSSVPACERLMVEPLSVDDWEILELHAGFIESHLLDQVRVVWAGMIMPIWVQKSICIFIKISSMEPCYSKCSLLEQRTQVVVTPKVRRQNQLPHPTKGSDKTKPDDKHTQQDNTDKGVIKNRVKNDKVISPLACKMPEMEVEASNSDDFLQRVVGMVRSLWSGSVAQTSADTSEQQAPLYREEILGRDLDCNLRVQPYGNLLERQHHRKHRNKKFETGISEEIEDDDNAENDVLNIRMVNIGHQPTIVYINEKTLHDCLPLSESVNNSSLPKTFLATLCRLRSASEKEDLMKKEMKKEKQSRRLAKKEDAEVDLPDDPNDIKHTTVIRVAVLNRTNSYRLYSNQGTQVGKVEFTESHGALPGHVMMHDLLRRQVGCEVMGRLRLEAVHGNAAVDPSQLQLLPLFKLPSDMTSDMVTSAFKMWLWDVSCEQCPLVVTQGTLVKFFLKQDMLGEFLITFTSRQEPSSGESTIPQFCLLHRGIAEKLQVLIKETVDKESESKLTTHLPRWSLQEIDPVVNLTHRAQLGGVDNIIKQAVDHIRLSLGVTPLPAEVCSGSPGLQMGGLLLCGARGMGKTCLSKAVARCLAQQPYLAYVAVVECKPLRGKRVEVIYRHMEKVLNEAAWRQPSLVVLDDLDVLAAAPSGPEQDMSGEALYHTKVAEMIKDLFIAEIRHKSKIAILATCKSRSSLHTSLTSPKGHHFFQETLEIKPPTEQSRELVLKAILHCKTAINPSCIKDLDLRQVAVKTEGFTPRDLVTLTDRAIHAHYMKQHDLHVIQESKEMSLVDGDIEVALDGFTPAALRGIDLHKAGDTGWQDVGGLHHVRTTLVETLQWPAKYPKLFAQMPLRLRSGLLLYGAPGTGKTLLAGVLAKECGLNFISIKGPELLSKYIGASEQAVRDTFLRAQSAKPCILFFDEFDSLAPRRGHDSTGVTDRVVNQLLTQLDGVEGLEGVYVLGATSRPDLIDPALLRPGRLDKALCCTMPTQDERLEILTALSRKVNFSDDVDLSEISSMCDHFTGADFKALLYNAQLAAIHEMTDSLRGKRISSCSSDSSQDSNAKFEMIEKGNFIALPTDGTDLNVSSKQPPDGSTVHEEDHQTELKVAVSEKAQPGSDKVVLIPTLEEGVVTLEPNTYDKLIKQMERFTVQDAGDSGSGKKLVSGPATIQRKHMLRAARTMNPSVSHQERTRYQMIYENFVASRGGHFGGLSPPGGKKATLA